ncbi:hypothetical protein [Actinoplanes sp. URMC 104]|uniref:hypothetical protein n=1 Tax=Actinoplanes sp. URMC 104 TaxID=3423409 RepID=UPI003F1D1FAE
MDRIPSDIEVAVRAVGESSKGYAGELSAVYRRARRRRRTHRAAAALTAVAVAAGLVGGFAVRHQVKARPFQPAVDRVPATQRLLLSHADGRYVLAQGHGETVVLNAAEQVGELGPDDRLVTHPVRSGARYEKTVGLPDGRLVSLGPRDNTDGVLVTDDAMLLTVDTPGGATLQRDVRRAGEPVSLLSADATTAYLWRPEGIAAYDLASGLERLVMSSDSLELPADDPAAAVDAADLLGDRLVIAGENRSCRPLLLNLPALQALRFLPLTELGCRWVEGLRLSPSTGRVAVTYRVKPGALRVAVLSTEDGAVLADREVATLDGKVLDVTVDVAWQDERTVRGVVVPRSAGVQILRSFTIAS